MRARRTGQRQNMHIYRRAMMQQRFVRSATVIRNMVQRDMRMRQIHRREAMTLRSTNFVKNARAEALMNNMADLLDHVQDRISAAEQGAADRQDLLKSMTTGLDPNAKALGHHYEASYGLSHDLDGNLIFWESDVSAYIQGFGEKVYVIVYLVEIDDPSGECTVTNPEGKTLALATVPRPELKAPKWHR